MKTVITGGSGFLGRKLAPRLLAEWPRLEELILVDVNAPDSTGFGALGDERVTMLDGDMSDPDVIDAVIDQDTAVVFHLASVVSAGAEDNFDLGYTVNLQGTMSLLERCREVYDATGRPVTVVFASSLAAYGSSAGPGVDDLTGLRPETSYGTQKAACELLINDYHRKGFIDGRGLRLPTVAVRPGSANLAASGFASAIIREPLQGLDYVCPVAADTAMAVISPRRVIDALGRIVALDSRSIGPDRTVLLPGLPMTMAEAVVISADLVQSMGLDVSQDLKLGTVHYEVDPDVQGIVDSWPRSIVSRRAVDLGLVGDPSVAAIVRQHILDEVETPSA